ncbi:hypothetical protein AB4Y44_42940, partial [Paraburkholderia sp. BR10937]
ANLQYAWTLFVVPMDARHHWGQAAIQLAFSIFIVTETWLVPVATLLAIHGGWNMVFDMVACVAMMAGVSAKVILQPMRRR